MSAPLLPPLASAWDLLSRHPELFLVALVVIVGVINAISKQAKALGQRAKKLMESGGGGFQDAGDAGTPMTARRAPPAAEPAHEDPETLLPEFLRPSVWRRAQAEGMVDAEPAPPAAMPVAEIRLEPIAVRRAVPRPVARPASVYVPAPVPVIEGESDVYRHVADAPAGAGVRHARSRHGLLGVGLPDRDAVRRAVLWAEVLGPPRALRPYRSLQQARR